MNLGLRKDHNRSRTYTGIYDLGSAGKNDAPDLSEGSSDYESWVLENTLNYDKVFVSIIFLHWLVILHKKTRAMVER